jgi:hypothetical protein
VSEAAITRFRRDHVGFVFQFYNLIASLTAEENVALVTEIAARPLHRLTLWRWSVSATAAGVSRGAVRRRAAAGGHRPGHRQAAGDSALRRAHGRARQRHRRDGAARPSIR